MPLQAIGGRRFLSRVLLLLLSGLFAVTVAAYGFERELYLPVELFHLLFQSREVGFFAPCALDDLPELGHVLFQRGALLAEFLQRRFDRTQRVQRVERRRARVSGQIAVVVL